MVNQIVAAVIGAMVLMASGSVAAAEPAVTELPLESGGIQRVLLISPANPRANNAANDGPDLLEPDPDLGVPLRLPL